MKIRDLINMIPQDSENEALLSIESIITYPYPNIAKIRCHLSHEFVFTVEPFSKAPGNQFINLCAEGRPNFVTVASAFVSSLKMFIYRLDEAISEHGYRQTPPPKYAWAILPEPQPPAHMDIPVMGADGKWYDAEY